MKNTFLIVFIIAIQSMYSQVVSHPDAVEKSHAFGFNKYEEGKIFFRDGTQLKGLIKITTDNKIKYKKTAKDKKQVFDYKKAKSVKKDHGEEYYYKINKKQILLLKREKSVVLNLYSVQLDVDIHDSNGFDKGFYRESHYTNFYIGKKDSYKVDYIPTKQTNKNFIKIISKYISDCPELLELIKDKKTIKENFENNKQSIIENIVDYYHQNCNK